MHDFFVNDYSNNATNNVKILRIRFLNYLPMVKSYHSKKYLISIYIIKLIILYNSLMRISGHKSIWCYA